MNIKFKKNLSRVLPAIFIILFFVSFLKPFENNIFNIAFGDEDDNFVTGSWLLKGKELYRDVFFQHQPTPSIISAGVQKITKPNTTFLLVKRHREFIFFYSLFWILLLTYRFGLIFALTGITFELTKFTLLGNLFLAESLVAYPVMYVCVFVYSSYQKKKKVEKLEILFLLSLLLLIQLTLLPMLPFVLFSFLMIYIKEKKQRRFFILSSIGLIFIATIMLIPFLDFRQYFIDTIVNILLEYIPSEAKYSPLFAILSVFFLPIKVFFLANDGFYLCLLYTSPSPRD